MCALACVPEIYVCVCKKKTCIPGKWNAWLPVCFAFDDVFIAGISTKRIFLAKVNFLMNETYRCCYSRTSVFASTILVQTCENPECQYCIYCWPWCFFQKLRNFCKYDNVFSFFCYIFHFDHFIRNSFCNACVQFEIS